MQQKGGLVCLNLTCSELGIDKRLYKTVLSTASFINRTCMVAGVRRHTPDATLTNRTRARGDNAIPRLK